MSKKNLFLLYIIVFIFSLQKQAEANLMECLYYYSGLIRTIFNKYCLAICSMWIQKDLCSREEHKDLALIVINLFGTFIFWRQSIKEKWEIVFNFSTICHFPPFKIIAFLPPSKMNWFLSDFFLKWCPHWICIIIVPFSKVPILFLEK